MLSIRSLSILAFFAASALAGACGSDGGGGGSEPEGKPTGATCPTTQTLTYDNFGQAFMKSYCLRCHSKDVAGADRLGAPEDHNFDTVEEIRPLAEHIDGLAGAGPDAINTAMPEGDPSPSEEDRRKLAEWLACGAP